MSAWVRLLTSLRRASQGLLSRRSGLASEALRHSRGDENRQVPPTITRKDLDEADDVVDLVTRVLIDRVNARPDDEQLSYVAGLTPGMRMAWGVFMVDMEVNNGGFNQFFWNSSSDYVAEAREGFRLIGADAQAALVDEALRRYEANFGRLVPYYQRGTLEAFSESYAEQLFDDLDNRYFEVDSNPMVEAYIRAHPQEFID